MRRKPLKNILKLTFLGLPLLGAILVSDAAAVPGKSKAQTGKKAAAERPERAHAEEGPECKAMLLMDAATGEVLHEENITEPLPPASMVKLMVGYVVLKRVTEAQVSFDDLITVSRAASNVGGSQVYLKEGEQFTLKQLFEAVMIQSANDGALAIAEHVAGSREGFVEMMNQEAKALGMNQAEFHSPHGLPPSDDQLPDLVSANDFAILSRALLAEFPQILEITKLTEADFRDGEFKMRNHNHLVRQFPGCDGFKTGYYGKAGFSVTATAERNGVRLISVVIGCKERKKRDAHAARLLSTGFAQYKPVKIIEKGAPVAEAVGVANGMLPAVTPVTAAELTARLRAGQEERVERDVKLCAGLAAPVAENTPCGTVTLRVGSRVLGATGLTILEPVPVAGLTTRVRRYLGF